MTLTQQEMETRSILSGLLCSELLIADPDVHLNRQLAEWESFCCSLVGDFWIAWMEHSGFEMDALNHFFEFDS